MIKLVDYRENLSRGTILRCRKKYPYEGIIDFMITEVIGEVALPNIDCRTFKIGKKRTKWPFSSEIILA